MTHFPPVAGVKARSAFGAKRTPTSVCFWPKADIVADATRRKNAAWRRELRAPPGSIDVREILSWNWAQLGMDARWLSRHVPGQKRGHPEWEVIHLSRKERFQQNGETALLGKGK